jgi:outer membrane protein OmpA-like peptidoglycan-associated protein
LVQSVYFGKNSYAIAEKYKPLLRALAVQCASDSCVRVKMYGYADSTGSEEYNDVLSHRRVDAVYIFIRSCAAIDTSKVYRDALGKYGDLYDLHFQGAHLHQRCVDIRVFFYKAKSGKKMG